ncbi:23S rRNA (adenine(2030)-N(6))-methyltransferase RlmJ [Echinimonas agarilytica]|uniref:23S rRNA (adenine(2030)-N(6))-methyltransferase RlmJ n=1 Tax=Echinimonas agarilytica TaxID=1215918 RepID=UPI00204183CD
MFKHLALIQLLDSQLTRHSNKTFCFADTYAGLPGYPLSQSKGWKKGVGKLTQIDVPKVPSARFWRQHVALCNQTSTPAMYPGSVTLAERLITEHGKKPQLLLWDSSTENCAILTATFKSARMVHEGKTKADDLLLEQADFLLIDPPGLSSKIHPDYPKWAYICSFLALPNHMLVWLPLYDKKNGRRAVSHRQVRKLAMALDMGVSEVTWGESGMIGCQLLYRCDEDAKLPLQQVLSWMAEEIVNCRIRHF